MEGCKVMHEIPIASAISQGVMVTFFLVFVGVIWWLYIRSGNESLEQHRFDVLREDRNG